MNKTLKNILAFSLKNKYFILFLSLLLIISGIITFTNMPIEAFPDVTNTEISIITQWPGRSAEEVEADHRETLDGWEERQQAIERLHEESRRHLEQQP